MSNLNDRGAVPDPVVSAQLVIAHERRQDAFVLRLRGELDLVSSPLLEGELEDAEAAGEEHLVIDLSGLESVDRTGLTVLLAARRRSVENGHRLSLRRASPSVRQLFGLTGPAGEFAFDD